MGTLRTECSGPSGSGPSQSDVGQVEAISVEVGGRKMTSAEVDWPRIAHLPKLVVGGADLERVELLQRGLLPEGIALSAAGLSQLEGSPYEFVLLDTENTPLLWCRRLGSVIESVALRPVADGAGEIPHGGCGVLVSGWPDPAELERTYLHNTDAKWLVRAERGPRGRALLSAIRDGLPDADVVRIPWPTPGHRDYLTARLPNDAQLAESLGLVKHTVLRGPDLTGSIRGGVLVFFTGLSGAGKSTIAAALRDQLDTCDERPVTLLDGDEVRRRLSPELGFDEAGRAENVRRVSWVASLIAGAGGVAITALIAPFAGLREEARAMAAEAGADFVEVWVSTPLAECEQRDRKGLYALARAGRLEHFTGISSPYEEPRSPELTIDTLSITPKDAATLIASHLDERKTR